MATSKRTVSEITDNPESAEDDEEDDSALEQAQVAPPDAARIPIPNIVEAALNSAPTISEARDTAHVLPHVSIAELVGKTVVLAWKEPQKAFLPDDGTMRDGYFVTGAYCDNGKSFTTWIGQSALKRDLEQIPLPFKTIIVRPGRKYLFR
jgi:hypothetical protein